MMSELIKVRDLPHGSIVWKGDDILGVAGITLDARYDDYLCVKVEGHDLDYEWIGAMVG